MSNLPGIAEVTTRLRNVLTGVAGRVGYGTTVSTLRPEANASAGSPRINLYLYQATHNTSLRNEDLQTRRSDGSLLRKPSVALDLHYLVSFYGSGSGQDQEIRAQELLAETMLTLHQYPILSRNDEAAEIRITPTPLSLEDLSKLWSIFPQTPYTLSTAFQCSVVLLESKSVPGQALPVGHAAIRVVPFGKMVIEKILKNGTQNPAITIADKGAIIGSGLKGEDVRIRIGEAEIVPEKLSDTEIIVDLSTADLQAGVLPVQVIHRVGMIPGDGTSVRTAQTSNVLPLVLRPIPEVPTSPVTVGSNLDIVIKPDVEPLQQGILLLNGAEGTSLPSYVIEALPRAAADPPSATLSFPTTGVEPGKYLVRVQIDGAESLLETDAEGRYEKPNITIQ